MVLLDNANISAVVMVDGFAVQVFFYALLLNLDQQFIPFSTMFTYINSSL
jgi:hypothetical protein